ncbi:MAG: DNA polymerase/3'-5' exonuclease PolX [Epsilonproteobacteria bacterium]|nr:DNA polymerase/3'-5' exonuclease PolX [Campylobacterota bacterium]NPA57008.1 DNA polymerase/3'-5' exonuclease PolX [Campylobacterota bacterium]
MENREIARLFHNYADLLEIKGENPFKIRAYRNGARVIENLGRSVEELVREGFDLRKLPGVGKDLASYIEEIVKEGRFGKLEELEREIPPTLLELLTIEGLGPKRVGVLYRQLGITSLEGLRRALEEGRLEGVPGFGPTLIGKIKRGIELSKKAGKRFLWSEARDYADDLVRYLNQMELERIVVAGSFRRKRETVGDLDILVTGGDGERVIDHFVTYPRVREVLSAGTTRSSIVLENGLQVDLRSVPRESYGSALLYFTGSKAHNIVVRRIALERGLKINEYGLFRGEERIGGESEEEIYREIGLCFIEPELREDRGEIEACREGRLPELVELSDIRGDLHLHTLYSDGTSSIREMALAARERGYSYIAVTDHSKRLTVAHGLDGRRLLQQIEEIDRLNGELDGITILKGIEVDILEDGSLDLEDDLLKRLDVVVGAVHSKFNLSRERQTERILKAFENPYFDILAHPTGRIIGQREPMELDMERILERAKELGVLLEINSQPNRLDLRDIDIQLAKEMGIPLVVSSDAHTPFSLHYMEYGINQARRGWCEKGDIANTAPLPEFLATLRRRR